MNELRLVLLPFYRLLKYQKYFKKNSLNIKLSQFIWCFFRGFFPRNFVLYGLDKENYKLYVTDYQENFTISKINNKATKLINDKILFTEIASAFVFMPQIKGIIEKGQWVRYKKQSCNSFYDLMNYISGNKGVIIKPIDGDGGEGIIKISCNSNGFYYNKKSLKESEIIEKLKNLHHYFISDLVDQHDYSSRIYSKSINTIRLLTMIDPETKDAFIGAAAHRLGNERAYPVDNCAKGGFTASINVHNGILGKAVRTYFSGPTPTWYSYHPDTGSPIEGITVPKWEYIKTHILQIANNFPFLAYIGWDIVLQPNGTITILEANDGADLKLHQVHEPLLSNIRVKKFYQYHQAI